MNRMLWLTCVVLFVVSPLSAQEVRLRKSLEGYSGTVDCVAWSPNGKTLAGSSDWTIKLWDVATGRNTATLEANEIDWVLSVAWSPDGKTVASGSSENAIELWDAASGKKYCDVQSKTP